MARLNETKPLKATVTHLEMVHRPSVHYPLPVNVHTALMSCRNMPLHFYRYLQYQVGKPWHWVCRLRMDNAALAAVIHNEKTDIDVLYVDGAPAGFFELFTQDDGVIDLAYFGMMPHVHGRGLGKWFLGEAINTAWDKKPAKLTVKTNTLDHPIALQLYQRFGFSPVSQEEALIAPLTDADHLRLARM